MKKYTTIFFLALALNSNAQPTQFTYDAAGNRVQRSMLPALIIANGNNQSDSSNTEQATLAGYNMTLYPNTTEDMVYAPGYNDWPTHAHDADLTVTKIRISNVRLDKINQYVQDELGSFLYKALSFNCVTSASKALLKAGVLNIPFLRHPSLLQLQMFVRNNTYYTSFIYK